LLRCANAPARSKPVEDLLTATGTAGKRVDELDLSMAIRTAMGDLADLSDIEWRGVWTELVAFRFGRRTSSASKSAAGFVA
jgi:hypothetical protein